MAKHNSTGVSGESQSTHYLVSNGYKILKRNWRFNHLEVDIIAQLGNLIIFIEVKTRLKNRDLMFDEMISSAQEKRIIEAADQFMQQVDDRFECRFDLMLIIEGEITHIIDAFHPEP